jgi:hypothetical protein
MIGVCQRIRAVDIAAVLAQLPTTVFVDSGGTNGWIAEPAWLPAFVEGLHLEGAVAHAVVRQLPAGQGIPPHVDRGLGERRFHVPLVTHPAVTMRWPDDGVEVHLEAGYLYEVRFDRRHEIVHQAPIDRVHIQINTVNRGGT